MNNYPILAARSTWYKSTLVDKYLDIELITIFDNLADCSKTESDFTEIWNADVNNNGDIKAGVFPITDDTGVNTGKYHCYLIGNGSGKIALNPDSNQAFALICSLTRINNAHLLDTSEVTDFQLAFSCGNNSNGSKLEYVDTSTWNLSKCKVLYMMFYKCKNLISIDATNWDVSNVVVTQSMFEGCEKLTSVGDLSNWDMSNNTVMRGMFCNCYSLESIGDLSNWDVSKVKDMTAVFGTCLLITSLGSLSNWNVSNVTSMAVMFQKCRALTTLDLSGWDVAKVTDMQLMFDSCDVLASIGDISNWDVSSVTSMRAMFEASPKLTGIGDLADWDVSNVTDLSFMFWGASSIKEIDVSKWDVSKVTNFDHFAAHAGLRRKGIENWNTSSATNMNAMFHNCAEEELDLSGFDTSKVQFFCQMFENSPNLKRIKGLENWDTSSGLGFEEMFGRCYKLEEVDLSSFDTSKAKNGVEGSNNGHKTATLNNMFYSCNNLKKVTVGPNFSINGDGTNTAAANMAILPTPSADYIAGADGMWYTFNGDAYAPNAMKDRTYNIYYASKNLIRDLSVRVNNGTILDIVKAIREKVPNLEPTLLSDLDDIILSKVFEPVLEVDEEGNAIITATALSVDEEGNATVV